MISWSFNADDYNENDFQVIPAGDHRVRISGAEECTSKNGNDMIKLTLDVSGYSSKLWYYLVFMPQNPQMTNNKLGQIFNSFGIKPGNMNTAEWVGCVGAARVKHELYNGETTARVSYFLSKEKQEQLPPWSEAGAVAGVTGGNDFAPVSEDDSELPF